MMLRLVPLPILSVAVAQTFYGCYTEVPNRALQGDYTANYQSMTVALCSDYCTTAGFSVWGIEYGGECYCGDALSTGSFPSISTDCNMPCPGNGSRDYQIEQCGGPNRLSLYGLSKDAPIFTPNPHLETTSTEPVGCYAEQNNSRALVGPTAYSETAMTVEGCGDYCLNSGYFYYGLEYGSECYCGSALHATPLPAGAAECSMACSGNADQVCGGPNRLSVYRWISFER